VGAVRIYCVRIGDKYGQLYEDYINEKLSDYEVIWIKEPIAKGSPLQWNKMAAMNDNSDEPVVVLDIDQLLINDYKEALDYPIKPGEFLACPYHWGNAKIPMSGGFYKFYPKECKYIYNEFINRIDHWTTHYIKNGYTTGPVGGEFLFVYEQMSKKLKLKLLPDVWIERYTSDWPDKTFNQDTKMLHFTNSLNKPHEWSEYKNYI
jgi:hypothetical protein